MRPDRLSAVERSGEVDPEVALPELGRLVVELRGVVERAGVVDEDVDRAELLHRARDRRIDLLAVCDVAADGERAPPHRLDVADRLLGVHEPLLPGDSRKRAVAVGLLGELRFDEQVGDDDVGARPSERQRVGATRAPRSPRDESNSSREVDLNRHAASLANISFAITSRWICDVPS